MMKKTNLQKVKMKLSAEGLSLRSSDTKIKKCFSGTCAAKGLTRVAMAAKRKLRK